VVSETPAAGGRRGPAPELRVLEDRLAEALEPAALRTPSGSFDWDTSTRVGDFDVETAARCQANAAGLPSPFEPGIFTTFKAVARAAAPLVASEGGVRPALVEFVRRARSRHSTVDNWLCDHLAACDQPTLVETMHRAASWLHGTAAVLGDPTLGRWSTGRRFQWDFPGRQLRLQGSVDLIEQGSHVPLFVVPSIDDARLDRIAFSSMLYALKMRSAPPTVRVVVLGTGADETRQRDELWSRAVQAAAWAADAVTARPVGPDGLHRAASFFTCRGCDWAPACAVRAESQARPPVRQGVRLR
jgi:hypothetical protein